MSLFDLLSNILPDQWFEDIQSHFGPDLSNADIIDSVHDASTFFNMDDPAVIREDWTTGVYTNLAECDYDDVLVFNRQQLSDMGISEKQGFDLVMTHEGAHRALQGLDTGYTSHQEELCCDYMSGVRAGLNGMDASIMKDSLVDTPESSTHPAGHLRVDAIEEGIVFAQNYMDEHGVAPTFSECLEHFDEIENIHRQVNLRPEPEIAAFSDEITTGVDGGEAVANSEDYLIGNDNLHHYIHDREWLEHQIRISHGSEQAHWIEELDWVNKHGFVSDGGGPHEFIQERTIANHGGLYGNATGDYIDDSHPESNMDTLKGLHVEDRAWNLKKSAEYAEKEKIELHEAKLDSDAGRMREAAEHARLAASYHRSMEEYKHAASICNK